ncbi:MAG: helicase-related protein, partial [Clostridia bacterium]
PTENQTDDLIFEINARTEKNERTLITALTKKMAEDLSDYLQSVGVKARYLHHDIDTLQRMKLIKELRMGEYDVLVGINLLREGLDIPEVSLIAILDADKEGFLRSETALIQTVGRAARNIESKVIMYADNITGSMARAISETNRRRKIQTEYNLENNITPTTIIKDIVNTIEITKKIVEPEKRDNKDIISELERLKGLMQLAADSLDFESAIRLRDRVSELKQILRDDKKNNG